MQEVDSVAGQLDEDDDAVASAESLESPDWLESPTRTLAAFAAATSFEDLSAADLARATRLVIEAIGCALGAHAIEQGRMYADYAELQGGRPESTVIGTRTVTSAPMAAWANAGLINTLDFDDTLFGHPGATVVGPAIAVGEARHVSGRDLLTAVVVGYEVSLRVAESIRASTQRWRQVAASSSAQTFGAAAAAAKLLDLDARATARAYGLAASMAPVPAVRKFGTRDGGRIAWTKNQYCASAIAGVMGAQLAGRGITGPETILDGDTGFWVMAGSDRSDTSVLTAGLGGRWRIHRVAFKPYPCCRFFHAAVDGLAKLVADHNVAPDAIAQIRVSSVSHLQTFLNRMPQNPFDAEFSLPHALALIAIGVPPGLAWFDPAHLEDPTVLSLMNAVEVVVDERAEDDFCAHRPYATTVELVTRDGTRRRVQVVAPLGHPSNPMSEAELDRKFMDLAGSVVGHERAEDLLALLRRLPDLDDIGESLHLLA